MKILRFVGLAALAGFAAACASKGAPPDLAAERPESTPPAPVYIVDDILGVSPAGLDNLLGEAALTRREGAGEYRRYALSACSLIVILYPDETGEMKVVHLDAAARSSREPKPDLRRCLAAG